MQEQRLSEIAHAAACARRDGCHGGSSKLKPHTVCRGTKAGFFISHAQTLTYLERLESEVIQKLSCFNLSMYYICDRSLSVNGE